MRPSNTMQQRKMCRFRHNLVTMPMFDCDANVLLQLTELDDTSAQCCVAVKQTWPAAHRVAVCSHLCSFVTLRGEYVRLHLSSRDFHDRHTRFMPYGIRTFSPPGHIPPRHSPSWAITPPFLHGVGPFPLPAPPSGVRTPRRGSVRVRTPSLGTVRVKSIG